MTDELSKGFTGIEINGVRFSNLGEMLRYMDKQRDYIIKLEKENAELKSEKGCESCTKFDEVQLIKAKELLNMFLRLHYLPIVDEATLYHKVEQFLSEVEK